MRWGSERIVVAGVVAAVVLRSGRASADSAGIDTSYGRFDGDVTVVLGAGVVLAPRNPRAAGEARLRYLETAGWFASYEDAAILGAESVPQRLLATGLELRPFFLFRWLQGHETERAFFDLTLDSIGLELGVVFAQPVGGDFSSRPGLQVGLGLELPLSAIANGAWIDLHGGIRWSSDALGPGVVRSAVDDAAYLAITLAWHQLLRAHVVDHGDLAPQ